MVFDTDLLIWFMRGNVKAAKAIDAADTRSISLVTYMELLQGARDKAEVRQIKLFLTENRFVMHPLTENLGHRASIYMEAYGLKVALSMADALIAATAVEVNEHLLTGNAKHLTVVEGLELQRFRP